MECSLMSSESESGFVKAVSVEELQEHEKLSVNVDGQSLAAFWHDDEPHIVDLRCPHMGFPLHKGTVEDGILTCHWHHARFELSCGDTFDLWADDVRSFPAEIRDGDVWVDPSPKEDRSEVVHWNDRLEDGLEENIRLVTAKSVIGLLEADVPFADPLTTGVRFGVEYREDGWGRGLTVLAAMGRLGPALNAEDAQRALYRGLTEVANNSQGEPPRFTLDPLSTRDVSFDRLKEWFRENVEVRDRDGAERCLLTAIAMDLPPADLADLLFSAATDHRYLDAGHTVDFINKAFETLDRIGWEHAEDVLPSLIPRLTTAERSEELSSWRQPINLADILADAYEELPELAAASESELWKQPAEFQEILLGDDPHHIVNELLAAVEAGATPEQLAACVSAAAATRIAQFSTANEFNDWDTVHHTFTYANAVHQAARRTDAVELYRAVFDGAMSVYLDRFLNTPPAPIPDQQTDERSSDELLDALLETFDEEGTVNEAGRLTAAFIDAGGNPTDLKRALGHGLLREDADFHTLQNVEAAFQQFDLATDPDVGRTAVIATARYLAAHTPTRREREQTFTIARRLHRGDTLHENAP